MKDKAIIDELCQHERIVSDGEGGWSNDHPDFDFSLFHCYWCLKGYKTWDESRTCNCDKTGTPTQMVR